MSLTTDSGPFRGEDPRVGARGEAGRRDGEFPRVSRSRRSTLWSGIGALVVVLIFASLPYTTQPGVWAILTQGLIILTLASMWNLLAGYAGLVSVGQQVFLGLGAYFILIPNMHGVSAFAALPFAAIGAAAVAIPLWWLVSRLRTAYFAIATWVLASAVALFVQQFQSIGGGTGMPLQGLQWASTNLLSADTYWVALAVAVLAIGGTYLLLRSRVGLVLTAIRDDERAARSSGVRVGFARALVFIVAAAGCGAAGGVLAIQQVAVSPGAGGVFDVTWTAEMAFAVIIGGLGTIEGPIVGTVVYMVLFETLQHYNAWYLIILGLVAIAITLFARRGLWGTVEEKFGIRLLPTGYYLWPPGEKQSRPRRRSLRDLWALVARPLARATPTLHPPQLRGPRPSHAAFAQATRLLPRPRDPHSGHATPAPATPTPT